MAGFARDVDTPALDTDLPDHIAIWVGVGGTLNITTLDGQTRTIAGIAAGTLLPLKVKQINSGGTAGSLLIFL